LLYRRLPSTWEQPRFWGEAGQVGTAKIRSLVKRYPSTHFAIAKWAMNLDTLITFVSKALDGLERKAPFDLISFSTDSAERFIDERGHLQLTDEDVKWATVKRCSSYARTTKIALLGKS
jgi:hypothetical protein